MCPCGTHWHKKEIHTRMWEFLQEEDYLDDLVIHGRINAPYRNRMGVCGQDLPGLE